MLINIAGTYVQIILHEIALNQKVAAIIIICQQAITPLPIFIGYRSNGSSESKKSMPDSQRISIER